MITLATLPQATAQEVYDQVANHLLTQKRQAMNNDICTYHTPDGLKCAAGCLIADDEYDPDMEENDWALLSASDMVPNTHDELIHDLQSVHDNYGPPDWRDRLIWIAEQYRLEPVS